MQLAAGFKAIGDMKQALYFYAKATRLDPDNAVSMYVK
jgi:cytochrome c-type biogenesis protein CcmH/NrfG